MRRAAPALLGLMACACAATDPAPPPPPPDAPQGGAAAEAAAPRPAPPLAVARVAGRPIPAAALVEAFWQWDTLAVRDQLERLVVADIAQAEAARLGLVVDEEAVRARYAEDLAALEREVVDGGVAASVEAFVAQRLGADPASFLRRFRRDSAQAWLEERVVRAHLLTSERAELSVVVVADEAALELARADLAAGVPFADVARAHSLDPSAADGGRTLPIVRSEHSSLARAAFATPVGQVGGPIVDEFDGRRLLFRVEARPVPIAGGWDVLGPAVEASLAADPVTDPEVWQWRADMQVLYPLDLRPLHELVGEGDA